mgnify:CR=1 FL=1
MNNMYLVPANAKKGTLIFNSIINNCAFIKNSGAKYITFTSRHHDGFSMWNTAYSDYNIVDATPYGKDIVGMLAEECHKQGIMLNLYYSHIDWTREDYPQGRTARTKYRNPKKNDWASYYDFMNNQLTELLTNYGRIGAIWFDGFWDHDIDTVPFDWQLDYQYELVHKLQPSCLVANNHHVNVHQGEDIQIFERDVPGENKAGYSGDMDISNLPLETCQTMNGMWGYKVADQNYKSLDDLIQLLVKTSGMGANLLLNIGPQSSGELPVVALERLKGMGEWLRENGESIYETVAGDIKPQSWGVTTRKDDVLYVHILNLKEKNVDISRFEIYLTRQKMNLYSNFKERSSADCKFLQATLREEFNFNELPTNMMPVAQLEAIIGCLLAEEKLKNNNSAHICCFDFMRSCNDFL